MRRTTVARAIAPQFYYKDVAPGLSIADAVFTRLDGGASVAFESSAYVIDRAADDLRVVVRLSLFLLLNGVLFTSSKPPVDSISLLIVRCGNGDAAHFLDRKCLSFPSLATNENGKARDTADFSGSEAAKFSTPATKWWCGQSAEYPSPVKIPVNREIYREFFAETTPLRSPGCPVDHI